MVKYQGGERSSELRRLQVDEINSDQSYNVSKEAVDEGLAIRLGNSKKSGGRFDGAESLTLQRA